MKNSPINTLYHLSSSDNSYWSSLYTVYSASSTSSASSSTEYSNVEI